MRTFIAELMQPPAPLTRGQKRLLWLLFAVIALTRWWAMSLTAWDWDEALFVLGIREYDVASHHPHPPGFPLYIGLAKLVFAAIGNEFLSLQIINIAFATMLFPAVFLFAREARFGFSTSLLAATFCSFFSNIWFFGGTGFSDVPSIVIATAAAALLLRGCRSDPSYFAGTILLAIACGFRPQNIAIGLAPGIIATAFRLNRRWWQIVAAALIGSAIVAGAYYGAAKATGETKVYLQSIEFHQDYISRTDSFRNPERPSLFQISEDFFIEPFSSSGLTYLLAVIAIAGLVLSRRRFHPSALTLLTFLPVAIAAWFLLDYLSVKRFSIGYAPMLAILAASGLTLLMQRLRLGGRSEAIAGTLITLAMAVWAVPGIQLARTTESPTHASMQWLRQNVVGTQHRLFVSSGMKPFAEVYLPEVAYTVVDDDRSVPVRHDGLASYIVIEGASSDQGAMNFIRPRKRLWKMVRRRYFEVAVVPLHRSARFTDGWYEAENVGANVWRWMGARSLTELPSIAEEAFLGITFDVPIDALPEPPVVTVILNGTVVDRIAVTERSTTREYRVPAAPEGAKLLLETSRVVNPLREGISSDPRDLGLVLTSLRWSEWAKQK
jgi:hypothetical protein